MSKQSITYQILLLALLGVVAALVANPAYAQESVAAFDDGSCKTLFSSNQDFQSVLNSAHLKARRVLDIDNPFLSAQMKAVDRRFWYQP